MRALIAAAFMIVPVTALAGGNQPTAAVEKALKGMTPNGKPQSCVDLRDVPDSRLIDETTIIFQSSSRHAYVNHPPGGCPGLRPDHAIITRTPTGSLCRGDIITVVDPVSHMDYGSCGLGDFEPYGR
jgi:hypothetical protein